MGTTEKIQTRAGNRIHKPLLKFSGGFQIVFALEQFDER